MKIWKWKLDVTDEQTLMIPAGAKLLDVQTQGDSCVLWAICNDKAQKEPRKIAIYGTGNPIPHDPGEYIGTFQMRDGALVFHAFEVYNSELTRAQLGAEQNRDASRRRVE